MIHHSTISSRELFRKIKNGSINFAGNARLKIFGTLGCNTGKRMKKKNRVFFISGDEAKELHFRPCGHCMKHEYKKWKDEFIR